MCLNASEFIEAEYFPATTSDLSPVDFSLWGALQQNSTDPRHGSSKAATATSLDPISQETIKMAANCSKERLH